MIETGGRVHRDTLQFVHDKLVNAPVGVEAREKNRIAMARELRNAWSDTTSGVWRV